MPTKTEIKDKARQKQALEMLKSNKQKRLVQNYDLNKPLAQQAREAGFAETTATHRIYDMVKKNPRLKKAIELYHGIGDSGVGVISIGTVLEVQLDPESDRSERLKAAHEGLQVAGKLKQIINSTTLSINADISPTQLADIMGITPQPIAVQAMPEQSTPKE